MVLFQRLKKKRKQNRERRETERERKILKLKVIEHNVLLFMLSFKWLFGKKVSMTWKETKISMKLAITLYKRERGNNF